MTYKAPNGNWYTIALFYEAAEEFNAKSIDEGVKPIFTLYEPREGYTSARDTFVELEDPTGYKWAMRYLGSWAHWNRLMKAPWFKKAVEVWLEELHSKLKSRAIEKIQEISRSESPAQALAAAKFLAMKEYDSSPRGRPSKEEIKGELKKQVALLDTETEDLKRIGLKLVSNNANRA